MSKRDIDTSLYGLPGSAQDFQGMPYQKLGKSGLSVSLIGLGTWKFGYPETGDGARVNETDGLAILNRAHEVGVTFWDTANRYNAASGNSERIIGRWLTENPQKRRDLVLATKISGLMDGRTPNHCGLSRQNIKEAVYASLERLQTDTIDLLYFHTPDDSVAAEESIVAVDDLIRQDLVRYFAVSNYSKKQLSAYAKAEKSLGPWLRARICAVQNSYNLLDGERTQEEGVLDYCQENQLSLIAWSPLAEGLLTGRYLEPAQVGSGDRLYDQKNQRYLDGAVQQKLQALHQLALQKDVSITQLVLAYMLTLPGMGPVIPAMSSLAQLEENRQAAFITLSQADCAAIRGIFA